MEITESEKLHILIIEDDREVQDLYLHVFTEAGFCVSQAFDGEEGLEIAKNNPKIRVMIVDIMLPKLSGFEVIRKIRTTAIQKDIPIIVVSALSGEADRQQGLEVGANEYIAKGEILLNEIVNRAKTYALSSVD